LILYRSMLTLFKISVYRNAIEVWAHSKKKECYTFPVTVAKSEGSRHDW
jgi:hypothetical protein